MESERIRIELCIIHQFHLFTLACQHFSFFLFRFNSSEGKPSLVSSLTFSLAIFCLLSSVVHSHSLPSCSEKKPQNLSLPLCLLSPGFHCNTVFGMESGKISDDQISASSSFYDGRWLPRMARLNNEDNAWTPAEDSNKEYIQVITQTPLSLSHAS